MTTGLVCETCGADMWASSVIDDRHPELRCRNVIRPGDTECCPNPSTADVSARAGSVAAIYSPATLQTLVGKLRAYATGRVGSPVDAVIDAALGEIGNYHDEWFVAGTPRSAAGSAEVWSTRSGRSLHVVGASAAAGRLRERLRSNEAAGWSLRPVPPGPARAGGSAGAFAELIRPGSVRCVAHMADVPVGELVETDFATSHPDHRDNHVVACRR